MTAPRPPVRPNRFVHWARQQMRALDRWSSKAIVLICFFGIFAHAVFR